MEKTDEQIMSEFQSGDREAISMIFQRYKTPVLKFCLRLLGNRADAEEAAGEVFVAILATPYRPLPQAKFSTWLYTIARNQCISLFRKQKNVVSLWFSSADARDEQWDVADKQDLARDQMARQEIADQVRRAINKLPYEQKEAMILRQYEGFSYQEISAILGCSLEKVKILIFRAKEQLRGDLASFVKEGQA